MTSESPDQISRQKTAFTSLLMGIFVNSPIFNCHDLHGVSEVSIYRRYGDPFRLALETYSGLSTAEQVFLIHELQR